MPALDLLVFVLEALVPVLQTLPFSLDAQLTPPWRQGHVRANTFLGLTLCR